MQTNTLMEDAVDIFENQTSFLLKFSASLLFLGDSPHRLPVRLSPPQTTRWPHQIGIGPDDHKDPPPPLLSQSWRVHRADVSEGERVFVFWSPEETSHITIFTKVLQKFAPYFRELIKLISAQLAAEAKVRIIRFQERIHHR
ncbi:hypothetical protein PFLUV_G00122420 [Perca fluviatilis]|uniref:Uncharacterized protein n=1 Tax=Perca fluviatilis TaxID=8168 RepID=A0A6A5F9M8_PERFL|nr:hypothetical protein PFLUV_G00122420 [Perca fluviatilis]